MKVLISADMEGTCGVSSWVHVQLPEIASAIQLTNNGEYERFRLQMTREVNAAIQGAFEGGATEVIVNDSHDGQRNILIEQLHKDARYISGSDKRFGMMQGIDTGIDRVFFTGYHAKAGTVGAPLAHTWNLWIQDVRFNGISTGEFGINAAIAGAFEAPVVMVAGDDIAVQQTQEFIGEGVRGVAVKQGISSTSAMHIHPEKAVELIQSAAMEAMSTSNVQPFVMASGTEIEIDVDHQSRVDQMLLIPATSRAGNRTVAFTANNALEFSDMFRALTKIGGVSMFS